MDEQTVTPSDTRPGPLWLGTLLGAVAAIAAIVAVLSGFGATSKDVPAGPVGTRQLRIESREHVERAVDYPQRPPAGGDHAPIWANCGIYDTPVPPELAVHSMEHGAVWITYLPSMSSAKVAQLHGIARRSFVGKERFVILSPYEGLPSPVVASAWGRQLEIDDVGDVRLEKFVRTFAGGRQSPEPQYPCTGGAGQPKG